MTEDASRELAEPEGQEATAGTEPSPIEDEESRTQRMREWIQWKEIQAAKRADLQGQIAAKEIQIAAEERQVPYGLAVMLLTAALGVAAPLRHWSGWLTGTGWSLALF